MKILTGEFFDCFILSEELPELFEWLQEHFIRLSDREVKRDVARSTWQWECWLAGRQSRGRSRLLLTADYVAEGLDINRFPKQMFLLTPEDMLTLRRHQCWYLSILMDRKEALLFKTRWV
jgi:hypothetical protein